MESFLYPTAASDRGLFLVHLPKGQPDRFGLNWIQQLGETLREKPRENMLSLSTPGATASVQLKRRLHSAILFT